MTTKAAIVRGGSVLAYIDTETTGQALAAWDTSLEALDANRERNLVNRFPVLVSRARKYFTQRSEEQAFDTFATEIAPGEFWLKGGVS